MEVIFCDFFGASENFVKAFAKISFKPREEIWQINPSRPFKAFINLLRHQKELWKKNYVNFLSSSGISVREKLSGNETKYFKSEPSKICGRQPLKNLKLYVLLTFEGII